MDNGLGGGGKVSGFQLTGMIDLDDFFGFEIFQFQNFFGLVNLASIFWGGLIFLGIENNLKIRGIFPPIRSSLSLDRFPPPYPRATENLWDRD